MSRDGAALVQDDGSLEVWGSSLGVPRFNTPVAVDGEWVAVASGSSQRLGIKKDGTLWGWGVNWLGGLGLGDVGARCLPTKVSSDKKWVSARSGFLQMIGMKEDGTAWAWGDNRYYNLGDGTSVNRLTPVQIYPRPTDVPLDPPTALSPSGAVYSTALKLRWTPVAYAVSYRLVVTAGGASVADHSVSALDAGCSGSSGVCSYSTTIAAVGADYTWSVRAADDTRQSDWSNSLAVSLAVPVALSPSGTICDDKPLFTWQAYPGSSSYDIVVNGQTLIEVSAADAGCGSGTCSVEPASSLSDGAYSWSVKPKPASGDAPSSNTLSFTNGAGPDGTVEIDTPTFVWHAVPGVRAYQLIVKKVVRRGQRNPAKPDEKTTVVIRKRYTARQAGCPDGTGHCGVSPGVQLAEGSYVWQLHMKTTATATKRDSWSICRSNQTAETRRKHG